MLTANVAISWVSTSTLNCKVASLLSCTSSSVDGSLRAERTASLPLPSRGIGILRYDGHNGLG